MRDLSTLVVRNVHGVVLATWQELHREAAVVVHDPQDVLRVFVEDAFCVIQTVVFHRQEIDPVNLKTVT